MLQSKMFSTGDLTGVIFDFPEIDDVLPMHSHTPLDVHMTIVARGKLKAHGNGWEKEVSAGDVLDWQPNDPHEFIALEPNSRIVNIVKKMNGVVNDSSNITAG